MAFPLTNIFWLRSKAEPLFGLTIFLLNTQSENIVFIYLFINISRLTGRSDCLLCFNRRALKSLLSPLQNEILFSASARWHRPRVMIVHSVNIYVMNTMNGIDDSGKLTRPEDK